MMERQVGGRNEARLSCAKPVAAGRLAALATTYTLKYL